MRAVAGWVNKEFLRTKIMDLDDCPCVVLYLMTHNAISAIWAPGLSPGTSHLPLPAAKNLQRSPTPRH